MAFLKVIKNGCIFFGLTVLLVSFQSCDSSFNMASTGQPLLNETSDLSSSENINDSPQLESDYQLDNSTGGPYENNFFRDANLASGMAGPITSITKTTKVSS